jgi:hypothetical protein
MFSNPKTHFEYIRPEGKWEIEKKTPKSTRFVYVRATTAYC